MTATINIEQGPNKISEILVYCRKLNYDSSFMMVTKRYEGKEIKAFINIPKDYIKLSGDCHLGVVKGL